jgi:hypothetical protein
MATKFWISTSSTSFSTAANWSDGNAPGNNDTLIFNGIGTANCSTDLSSVLTGVTVIVEPGYSGYIGLVSGATANYLVLDGGTLKMPKTGGASSNANAGSQRVMIAFGSTAATVYVEATNPIGAESYYPPVMVKGTAVTATVLGGNTGFAVRPGDVATLASLRVAKQSGTSPYAYLGAGVTLTDAVLEAGRILSKADNTATTIRVGGAEYEYTGTGAHTTLHLDAGKVIYSGTGTLTTANVRGYLDLSQDPRAKTITTASTWRGSTINADNGVPGGVVFTNAINHYDGVGPSGCTLITPANVKGTLVSI